MRITRLISVVSVTAATAILGLSPDARAGLAQYHACSGTSPGPGEVYLYVDAGWSGQCAALYAGWFPYSGDGYSGMGGFGLPNDSLSSWKIGSGVRVKFFTDWKYEGSWDLEQYSQTYWPSGLEYYNDKVSSIKVETNNRARYCDDLQPGEFSLFQSNHYSEDCVVLTYPTLPATWIGYPDSVHMGIANDGVLSVRSGPITSTSNACGAGGVWAVYLYEGQNYGGGVTPWSISQGRMEAITQGNGQVTGVSSVSAELVCNPF